MVLIPLSRLYLGVHFPHDLVGGYLIGLLLLLAYLWLEPGLEEWLETRGLGWQLGLALGAPLLLVLLLSTKAGIVESATLMGMSAGFVLERRWVCFDFRGPWWKKGLRLLVGLVVLVGLWLGLRIAFAGLAPEVPLRFVRYALVGLWGSLGAPWVFVKLGLAGQASRTTT